MAWWLDQPNTYKHPGFITVPTSATKAPERTNEAAHCNRLLNFGIVIFASLSFSKGDSSALHGSQEKSPFLIGFSPITALPKTR